MSLFETLLALLLAAVVLLQASRRLGFPYPAVLAGAGVVVGFIPGTPNIPIDPSVALALFVAPAIIEATFDFPVGAARRFWAPLIAFAVFGVVITAAIVAWLGTWYLGLPVAAALALGAIVAPPDATAVTAVLGSVSIPRSSDAVLRGESLFNDATALLLFAGAVAVVSNGGFNATVGLHLALAAPGGVLLGIAFAYAMRYVTRFVGDTLGANLLQFVNCFLLWILAERLQLSAVLCIVALAMTVARTAWRETSTRMRNHTNAVWRTIVFALNVMAFFLMGIQARAAVAHMRPSQLAHAGIFATIVVVAVIVSRLAIVLAYNRARAFAERSHGREEPATVAQGIFVGWAGMRGIVTVATSFALPLGFPQRDTLVLTAFAVVVATLVVQGLTLKPLIGLLRLDEGISLDTKLAEVYADLTDVALQTLANHSGPEVDELRVAFETKKNAPTDPGAAEQLKRKRALGLAIIDAQRERLSTLQADYQIGPDEFDAMEEALDWRELALLPDDARRLQEG